MVAVPPILIDIVQGLTALRPELEVVARLHRCSDVAAAAERHDADVVMMTATAALPPKFAEELLYARPRARLLTISPDGRTAYLHRLLPHQLRVDDVSPPELMNALLGDGRYRAGAQ
jgi:hypothetical protein